MENKILKILNDMQSHLNDEQMKYLQQSLIQHLTYESNKDYNSIDYLKLFIDAKRIEGCSERTLKYYRITIEKMICDIDLPVRDITTEDVRDYLIKIQ